jgi:23S rRNA (uracil1939-C5)-methyltransferase
LSKTIKSNHIEKLVFGGKGLTRIEGQVTFVPFSAPGDEVILKVTKKKKDYQLASIDQILKEGPERIFPKCPHYQTCAGCQMQHLSYQGQLEAKVQFIQEALRVDNVSITPSPNEWGYRSHIRLNLAKESKGFKMGYIGWDNRTLITPSICPLFLEDSTFFQTLAKALLTLPNEGIKSASLRIFKQERKIYLAFSTFPSLPKSLLAFPFAEAVAYKSPGKERKIGTFPFSPYGFMQSNKEVTEKIDQTLLENIGPTPKKILDLYCGAGRIALQLGDLGHRVIGVEANSSLIPHSEKVKFICSRVETALPTLLKTFTPDLIIVNPPRTGLTKEILPYLKAPQMFYLSCMPSTLGRDIERLSHYYTLQWVKAFDMFPQTTHVETLVKLYHPSPHDFLTKK